MRHKSRFAITLVCTQVLLKNILITAVQLTPVDFYEDMW